MTSKRREASLHRITATLESDHHSKHWNRGWFVHQKDTTPSVTHAPRPTGSSKMKRLFFRLTRFNFFLWSCCRCWIWLNKFPQRLNNSLWRHRNTVRRKGVLVKPIAPFRNGNIVDFEMNYIGTTPSTKQKQTVLITLHDALKAIHSYEKIVRRIL